MRGKVEWFKKVPAFFIPTIVDSTSTVSHSFSLLVITTVIVHDDRNRKLRKCRLTASPYYHG
jgi:hypothetical protein